jgi:hypothetical protein
LARGGRKAPPEDGNQLEENRKNRTAVAMAQSRLSHADWEVRGTTLSHPSCCAHPGTVEHQEGMNRRPGVYSKA